MILYQGGDILTKFKTIAKKTPQKQKQKTFFCFVLSFRAGGQKVAKNVIAYPVSFLHTGAQGSRLKKLGPL